jgi:hypothetical protein
VLKVLTGEMLRGKEDGKGKETGLETSSGKGVSVQPESAIVIPVLEVI